MLCEEIVRILGPQDWSFSRGVHLERSTLSTTMDDEAADANLSAALNSQFDPGYAIVENHKGSLEILEIDDHPEG